MIKRIEIESCDNCKFAYDDDRRTMNCGLAKIITEHVEEGEVHKDCPLRKGPVQFCLAKTSSEPNDIARTRKCRDCGRDFATTFGELAYLEETFGVNFGEPTRCRPCRVERKRSQEEDNRNLS